MKGKREYIVFGFGECDLSRRTGQVGTKSELIKG